MKVEIIVVASDKSRGCKSTRKTQITVPQEALRLQEAISGDPNDHLRSMALLALQGAVVAVENGAAAPPSRGGEVSAHGGPPPRRAPAPRMEEVAPRPTPAAPPARPPSSKKTPRTADEILQQSLEGMDLAIQTEMSAPKQPGPGPIGFGPHRGSRSGRR